MLSDRSSHQSIRLPAAGQVPAWVAVRPIGFQIEVAALGLTDARRETIFAEKHKRPCASLLGGRHARVIEMENLLFRRKLCRIVDTTS